MNFALIENGIVVNLLWLYPGGEELFPGAVPVGSVPVMIGDEWDGSCFRRDGERVLSPMETMAQTVAELDAALLDMQYQYLIGGLEE